MLHRVDPKAVDAQLADPGLVDIDHPLDHSGVLGEQVIETEEVAVVGVLVNEGGVAAVVVQGDVVEPGWNLEVLLARLQLRGVREDARIQGRETVGSGVVAVVERGAGRGAIWRDIFGYVRRACPSS